jgi:hypothetical protein
MAFKVGDRVTVPVKQKYIENSPDWGTPPVAGQSGTVIRVDSDDRIRIRFDGADAHFKEWSVPIGNVQMEKIPQSGKTMFPTEAKERKQIPLGTGLLDYFPQALIEVAKVSFAGNQQHNPGEPLHWARGKSMDQDDTVLRHYMERGKMDDDGVRHSAKMVWRALAILQLELEAEGYPKARGAK